MTKQQSRARSAGVMALARHRGARGFLVPLVVPVAALALCVSACSSTSAKNGSTAHPVAHQTTQTTMPGSTSTATPSGSPSLSAAACEHVRKLREDLIHVTHIKYNGSTARVVAVDLAGVRKELAALKNEPAIANEVGALDRAVVHVQDAIRSMSMPPTVAQFKAVGAAFNHMKAVASPMIAKFKADCPS